MTQIFKVHPENPQVRLMRQVVECLQQGGVVVVPTDTCYALVCGLGQKDAADRIRKIRGLKEDHYLTLLCKDLSALSTYAKIENDEFRFIKAHTPGPYAFLLRATHEVPRRLQHPKRKTIGLRVPNHPVLSLLMEILEEPLLSSTLQLSGDEYPLTESDEISEKLNNQVDLIIDAGSCGLEQTTIIDFTSSDPHLVRLGKGLMG